MLHFTCDLCGLQLGDRRFVAKLEVYPAFDPEELDEDDLDVDHLQPAVGAGAHVPKWCIFSRTSCHGTVLVRTNPSVIQIGIFFTIEVPK